MAVNDPKPVATKTVTVKYIEWGEYHYFASFCLSFGYREKPTTDADVKVTRIWADGELIYSRAPIGGVQTFKPGLKFTVRAGTSDQMPVGGAELAYRDQLLIWFHDYDFGTSGSFPAFTAEFTDDNGATLIDALEAFAIRAGYDEEDIDIDPTLDYPIVGYVADGQATLNSINTNLGFVYNFTGVEVAGIIQFHQNYDNDGNAVAQWTISQDQLAVISENSSDQQVDVIEIAADQGLPRSITIDYYDVDFNYDKNTQTAARNLGTSGSDTDVSVSIPIVGQAQEMKAFATDALYRSWDQRNGHSLRLPRSYMGMDPGDVLQWTNNGETFVAEAQRVTVNGDWSVSVSAAEIAASFSPITTIEYQPPSTPVTSINAEPVNAVVFDIPDWLPTQVQPGLLNLRVAMGGYEPGKFTGARFDMTRTDQPTGWAPRVQLGQNEEIGIGALVEKPTNYSGPAEGYDATTVLRLDLRNMVFSQIVAGVGELVAVGKDGRFELLRYDTANFVSGYAELSGLTRGLFGTEDSVNQHDVNDHFAFVEDLKTITYTVDDYTNGRTFFYRGVGPQMPTQDASVKYFKPLGNSRRPYSPNNIEAIRTIEGDIIFKWEKQDRFAGEPDSIWSVEIYSEDWTVLLQRLNNIIIGDITEHNIAWTYYLDYQFENGINELTTINALVYQMNTDHGVRGFPGGGGITARQQGILAATSILELTSYATIGQDLFLKAESKLELVNVKAVLTGGRDIIQLSANSKLELRNVKADLLVGGLEAHSTLELVNVKANLSIVGEDLLSRSINPGVDVFDNTAHTRYLRFDLPAGTEVGDLLIVVAELDAFTPRSSTNWNWGPAEDAVGVVPNLRRMSDGTEDTSWTVLDKTITSYGVDSHFMAMWKIVEAADLASGGWRWNKQQGVTYNNMYMTQGTIQRLVNFRPNNPITGFGKLWNATRTNTHTAPSVQGKAKGKLYNHVFSHITSTPVLHSTGHQKPSDMNWANSHLNNHDMVIGTKDLTVDGATGSKTYTPPTTTSGA